MLSKIRKHTNLLLFFSITSLVLINFLPWVVVSEQLGSSEDVFFNYEMMKKNDTFEILELTDVVNNIMVLTWLVVMVGLICIAGVVVYLSGKIRIVSLLMLGMGLPVFVLNVFVVYLFLRFIQSVGEFRLVSLAYVFKPFSYSSVIFVFMFLSLFTSFGISKDIIMFLAGYYKNFKSMRRERISSKYSKLYTSSGEAEKTFLSSNNVISISRAKREEWSKNSEQQIERVKKEDIVVERTRDGKKKEEVEKVEVVAEDDLKQREKEESVDKKENVDLIKKDESSKPSSMFDHTFEQVLFSAIEKKKKEKELGKEDVEGLFSEKQIKHVGGVKKFKIRCLKCKNEFIAEIRDGDRKIRCPACGEEGEL